MEDGSTLFISAYLSKIPLVVILLCLSAFFSSSETALFSLTREAKKEMHDQETLLNRVIISLLRRPRTLLITLLLGNMLVNVSLYCITYGIAKGVLETGVKNAPLWAGIIGCSSLLTIIIFGEVIPKNIAVRIPRQLSRIFAIPVIFFTKIFLPFSIPLDFITDKISKFFIKKGKEDKKITIDELKMIVEFGQKQGLVDEAEHTMLDSVLDFQSKQVKEVMVPRVDMTAYDVDEPVEGFLDLIRKTKYTKIPVYQNTTDTIIGVVHAKDVFLNPGGELKRYVRPIPFIPETNTIESLLSQFRREHRQIAIVIDEYGGTAGLITMEDILEEIVGDIEDEHERHEEEIKKLDINKYLLSGNLNIREWQDYFEVKLDSADFDTIGGLVLSLLGRVPQKGDVVEYGNMRFTVERIRRHRIIKVLMETTSL